jgi:hypothetical protein
MRMPRLTAEESVYGVVCGYVGRWHLQGGTDQKSVVTPSCQPYGQLPNGSCCPNNGVACTSAAGVSCCVSSVSQCLNFGC